MQARQGDITCVISDERAQVLETGGGLAKARHLLGDDPIFVVNTDAFWGTGLPQPLQTMMDAFDPALMDIQLLLADKTRSLGFNGAGDFFMAGDNTLSRRGEAKTAPYAFTGVRIINPKIYDNAPVKPFSSNVIWNDYLENGRVHGVVLDDFWLHVGDPTALADAETWLKCH